jgi:RsiW-degrading membrane proteinase PrsW (M82 family)
VGSLILYLFFVLAPVVFWFWFFRWKDSAEPEPKKTIFKLFIFWAAAAAIFSIFSEWGAANFLFHTQSEKLLGLTQEARPAISDVWMYLFLVALIEELFKLVMLRNAIYFAPSFNQILDGAIYGVSLALGFAFFENTFYFFNILSLNLNSVDSFYIVMARAIGPLCMHFVTTGIVGLYLGRKKFSAGHKGILPFIGLGIATVIHFSYNLSLYLPDPGFLIGFVVVFSGLFYLLKEISKPESKMVWKLVSK